MILSKMNVHTPGGLYKYSPVVHVYCITSADTLQHRHATHGAFLLVFSHQLHCHFELKHWTVRDSSFTNILELPINQLRLIWVQSPPLFWMSLNTSFTKSTKLPGKTAFNLDENAQTRLIILSLLTHIKPKDFLKLRLSSIDLNHLTLAGYLTLTLP